MTDIAKLKQEAEEARQKVIAKASGLKYPEEFIGLLFDATAKEIALQAAEKEAEARKYEEDRRKAALMALSDEVRASIIPQVIVKQCRYMSDLPAPAADRVGEP